MHAQDPTGALGYVPSYSTQGLRSKLDNWIGGGGAPETFFKFKVADIKSLAGGEDIFLEVTTKGSGKFDIHNGLW